MSIVLLEMSGVLGHGTAVAGHRGRQVGLEQRFRATLDSSGHLELRFWGSFGRQVGPGMAVWAALGRQVAHGTAVWEPLDVKLALERRFGEPLDVKTGFKTLKNLCRSEDLYGNLCIDIYTHFIHTLPTLPNLVYRPLTARPEGRAKVRL